MQISSWLVSDTQNSSYALFKPLPSPNFSEDFGPSTTLKNDVPWTGLDTSVTSGQITPENEAASIIQQWLEVERKQTFAKEIDDIDGFIAPALTDQESIGIPKANASYLCVTQYKQVRQGQPLPPDADEVNLMTFDVWD